MPYVGFDIGSLSGFWLCREYVVQLGEGEAMPSGGTTGTWPGKQG